MRRQYFYPVGLLTLCIIAPLTVFADDQEIATQIQQRLRSQRDAGVLKAFSLNPRIEQGIVVMRGSVRSPDQKQIVLNTAKGIQGVKQIVDKIAVTSPKRIAKRSMPTQERSMQAQKRSMPAQKRSMPTIKKQQAGPSLRDALVAETQQTLPVPIKIVSQAVIPAGASEMRSRSTWRDREINQRVADKLQAVKQAGKLDGFGVDVTTRNGDVWLSGSALSESRKRMVIRLARDVSGVRNVVDEITIRKRRPPKPIRAQLAGHRQVNTSKHRQLKPSKSVALRRPPARQVSATPPNRANQQLTAVQGTPMPMAQYAGGMSSPRYDQPNMPNYAWPGYAAYPNYAAVTYPQQYSPAAWPYIGPFYPYPQVPLGWRKVSLEWDDGWWFLDFTDR